MISIEYENSKNASLWACIVGGDYPYRSCEIKWLKLSTLYITLQRSTKRGDRYNDFMSKGRQYLWNYKRDRNSVESYGDGMPIKLILRYTQIQDIIFFRLLAEGDFEGS